MTTAKNKSIMPATLAPTVRCAIYTRKSTEEGLQQDFNTLDAQRESAEAYITAHKHEGWTALPDRYDDGGYTGGNLDRPAFKRLMADVEANKVDAIVVYKIDRLSRSLLDFGRVMEVLEQHDVALVAITQSLDTKTSMGRLTLNVLLSFAQFEREIISERTRDKIAAARRKGKWSGGKPLLGYDASHLPGGTRLVVNEDEASRVRTIFELYLKHEALVPTVSQIAARGWTNKRWTTRSGVEIGGRPFDKATLYKLLTNPTYLGKVRYKTEIHAGEHEAIIDPSVWQRVQTTLTRNGRTGGKLVRNKYGALLKGLLHCGGCNCSMGHAYTARGERRYRYYVCLNAQKRGWHTCTTKSVPAGEIERFVVEQIHAIGRDATVAVATARQARRASTEQLAALRTEAASLDREIRRTTAQIFRIAGNPSQAAEAAYASDRLRTAEQRMSVVRDGVADVERSQVNDGDVARSLAAFEPLWSTLSPKEQARVLQLLIRRVTYDGANGSVAVTFRAGAAATLNAAGPGVGGNFMKGSGS